MLQLQGRSNNESAHFRVVLSHLCPNGDGLRSGVRPLAGHLHCAPPCLHKCLLRSPRDFRPFSNFFRAARRAVEAWSVVGHDRDHEFRTMEVTTPFAQGINHREDFSVRSAIVSLSSVQLTRITSHWPIFLQQNSTYCHVTGIDNRKGLLKIGKH
jgi:hypothetical protein